MSYFAGFFRAGGAAAISRKISRATQDDSGLPSAAAISSALSFISGSILTAMTAALTGDFTVFSRSHELTKVYDCLYIQTVNMCQGNTTP